jgi:uncharacterized protein YifE (UPF0438 family)
MSESRSSFTPQEKVLLYRYYEFYRALETGKRKPSTAAQKHFVAVCEGRAKAETLHEKTYAKYMKTRATQRREQAQEKAMQTEIPEYEEGYPRPDWFTDDNRKKMRSQDFADLTQRRRAM